MPQELKDAMAGMKAQDVISIDSDSVDKGEAIVVLWLHACEYEAFGPVNLGPTLGNVYTDD